MTSNPPPPTPPLFLGIEGGGTRTIALLADVRRRLVSRFEAGPGNLRLLTDPQLTLLFRSIAAQLAVPAALGIGLAGARTESDRERIRRAAGRIWPGIPCHATHDLETALAVPETSSGDGLPARVLILSGTGSCCYGRNKSGKTAKIGGWGHILGDKGSGYEIALRALKALVFYYDRDGVWPGLGRRILQWLQLNEPDELVSWVRTAGKSDIAALACLVFTAWVEGESIAAGIIAGAEETLARDAIACALRLAPQKGRIQFVLAGGVLRGQPRFARRLKARLQRLRPGAEVSVLERESAWGAIALAQRFYDGRKAEKERPVRRLDSRTGLSPQETLLPRATALSPTEQRHPLSQNLDRLSLDGSIRLMLSEDAKVPAAILAERKKIGQAIRWIASALKRGGRLFYVGAGTSGRLGVLDASECPPTFGTAPEMVQGIIAGGQAALWRSVEGAEDDSAAGARAIELRGVKECDVVVGIAASGRTPFVWGALLAAKRRRARTILVAFNPFLRFPRPTRPALIILPDIGPEILTGSTRLKAGTATKLILNMFTTLALARLGKVKGNLMVDVKPANAKLRDRAVRMVRELRNVDYVAAQGALERGNWVIKKACALLDGRPAPNAARGPESRRANRKESSGPAATAQVPGPIRSQ